MLAKGLVSYRAARQRDGRLVGRSLADTHTKGLDSIHGVLPSIMSLIRGSSEYSQGVQPNSALRVLYLAALLPRIMASQY